MKKVLDFIKVDTLNSVKVFQRFSTSIMKSIKHADSFCVLYDWASIDRALKLSTHDNHCKFLCAAPLSCCFWRHWVRQRKIIDQSTIFKTPLMSRKSRNTILNTDASNRRCCNTIFRRWYIAGVIFKELLLRLYYWASNKKANLDQNLN